MGRRQAQGISSSGFTIVELLIVLAIAGLILLVVFEALPALTRSSRNNQRKQDISAISEALSHYELNNSGNLPAASGTPAGSFTPLSTAFIHDQNIRLSYYDPANIMLYAVAPPLSTQPAQVTSIDSLKMYNYEKCSSSVTGAADATGAGYRDVVALFALETGGAAAESECLQL